MRRLLIIAGGLSVVLVAFFTYTPSKDALKAKRLEYTEFLNNHPYNVHYDIEQLEAIPKKDRPDLAMYQNYLMTMDPATGEVPMDRLVKAYENQKKLRSQKSRLTKDAIPGVSWQEIGPDNIGGRTRALMWDPNDVNSEKLWAAGVAGGIWFNNNVIDPNSSWQKIDDFLANLAVTTIAYDPNNTMTFYAGTGEGYFNADAVRGAGIYKSTDGGVSWNLMESTLVPNFYYVQKVVVTENSTILASTRNGGLMRSTDGGASWTSVLNAASDGASNSRASDIEIAANGDIYATIGLFSAGSVHRSSDDGVTWTAITPPGGSPERIELAIAQSASSSTESTVIYAVASTGSNVDWFKKSFNGGASWSDLNVPRYRAQNCSDSDDDFTRGQAWYDLILAVKPTDENVVIAGGINVLKSSNGGTTMAEVSYWTGSDANNTCDDYVHADIHNIVFRPGSPDEAVIGHDGGVSYSNDLGNEADPTFDSRNRDYAVTQFYSVAAVNETDSDYFLAGAQDNGTLQFTTANGLSAFEVFGGDGAFCFIDQEDNNFQIVSFVRNNYYLLNANGGFVRALSESNAGRFINPADYDNTSKILYSAGGNDELRRITGITTTPSTQEVLTLALNGEQISALRADAKTANRLFIGTGSGGVYRIDDADQEVPTVTDITSDITQVGYISSIDIGLNDDELVVTISGFGVSSVWYTTDGGTSWLNKDVGGGLPDIPVRWALINPDNPAQVMLATDLGVWSSNDITAANPGWEQSSTNLANVRCDMLQYRAADKLVAVGTHGRGAFITDAFSGSDENPPLVSSLSPSNNASEVRLGVDLEISFNEPINIESGSVIIERVSDGSIFETIDIQSDQVTITNAILSINPTADFEPLVEYRVLVDANSVSDDFGNLFAGVIDDNWTFATFDGDEPPVLTALIPDQSVLVNADPIVFDLDTYFNDPDGDVITYEITNNTNDGLITTSLEDNNLTVTLTAGENGVGTVTVQAASNEKSAVTTFDVIVSLPDLLTKSGTVTGGSPSQRFPDFENSELESADSFTVTTTGGNSWFVKAVSVVGSNNGDLPVEAFFRIYADDNGFPGDLLFESDVTNIIPTTDGSDFIISAVNPFELTDGDYWLSVIDNQNFNGGTQWFWSYYESGVSDYVRRDPDQLLDGSWSADWEFSGEQRGLVFSVQGFELPAAPSNFTITELDGDINLNWSYSSSDASFVVERSIGDGEYEEIANLDPGTFSYSDPITLTNELFSYRVYALDASSNQSGNAFGSILSLPATPTLGEESDISFDRFRINWTTTDEPDGFSLDISLEEDFSTFLEGFENTNVVGNSRLVNNLEGGVYYYRMAASNASGNSAYTETRSISIAVLGVEESVLTIYPNPSNGLYQISDDQSEVVAVYDVLGRSVSFGMTDDGAIDIRNAESGSYVIQLRTNDEMISKTVFKK